ncbi:MAG: anti-sigma F factor [Clostridia bacterium]|nr:anti-sigma F factor [Clostridia bacterium]
MEYKNELKLQFLSLSENEGFARSCVASFCLPLNPSIETITDVKTAVSEAVTNCVVHAYPNKVGIIEINVKLTANQIYISVKDFGVGIEDVLKAKEPFFTSKPESERSGMGFTVMESFMDSVTVNSKPNGGTEVVLVKTLEDVSVAVGG